VFFSWGKLVESIDTDADEKLSASNLRGVIMFRRDLIAVWVAIIVLSSMFLMGQETWPPETKKWVFVTLSDYTGDLGGLEGADAICEAEADDAGLTGTYKAWLSDTNVGPDTRFTHSTVPSFLLNGYRVAAD